MDIVTLNIGGAVFKTKSSSLQSIPGTRLSRLSKSSEEYSGADNCFFFDRNPRVFEGILDFYRTKELHFPKDICGAVLRRELEFWKIPLESVSDCCFATICSYDESETSMQKLKTAFTNFELCFSDDQLRKYKINQLRNKLWTCMNYPGSSWHALVYSIMFSIWVILPILITILSTHRGCRVVRDDFKIRPRGTNGTSMTPEDLILMRTGNPKIALAAVTELTPGLFYMEFVCLLMFAFDILLRLVCHPSPSRLLKCPLHYLDLVVLITSIITFAADMKQSNVSRDERTLYIVCRSLSALRVIRLIHLTRHVGGLRVLTLATRASLQELFLLLISFLSVSVFFGVVMYYAEFDSPDSFPHMPISLWWSIVTMTTVGYGDFTPTTLAGYIIGSFCAMSGVLIISMPIAVIASNFTEYYNLNKIRIQKEQMSDKKAESLEVVERFFEKTNKVHDITCTGNITKEHSSKIKYLESSLTST